MILLLSPNEYYSLQLLSCAVFTQLDTETTTLTMRLSELDTTNNSIK